MRWSPFTASSLLLLQVDLMPTWHKFVPRALVLEELEGVFGGVHAYAELWLPWPLKNRALVMETAVFDALDHPTNAFVVDVSSAPYTGEASRLPTAPEDCPRLSFRSFTVRTGDAPHLPSPSPFFPFHLCPLRLPRALLGLNHHHPPPPPHPRIVLSDPARRCAGLHTAAARGR